LAGGDGCGLAVLCGGQVELVDHEGGQSMWPADSMVRKPAAYWSRSQGHGLQDGGDGVMFFTRIAASTDLCNCESFKYGESGRGFLVADDSRQLG